ncbi:hypothetical protein BCR35DRAFT_309995 [Leucosporidium creatinivorum]|uniref:Iron-sulfur assembly protein 1 n=1 Tax=Leucosporidium creatinivorum TaxID=106004 RepID=A0A1Y2DAQ7_9BASI|nr:hypothetical protein BCR35DRAFT_309995 [Leucosporidium creatinivorum]
MQSSLRSSLRRVLLPLTRPTPPCPACAHSLRFLSTSPLSPAPTLDRTPISSPSTRGAPPPPLAPANQTPKAAPKKQRVVKPRKAAISLTTTAVDRIRNLLDSPEPKLIRIGVRNKGCAGMSYHLEYVDKAERFDEVVEQDGVKVIVDSKALFSIIGSTMDWQEDALQAKFVFKNPNIKDACGCGESFIV